MIAYSDIKADGSADEGLQDAEYVCTCCGGMWDYTTSEPESFATWEQDLEYE